MRITAAIPEERKNLYRLLAFYTLLWSVCAALLYLIFRINGKLFLLGNNGSDGVYQHFVSFDYLCQYLRSLIIDHEKIGVFNYTLGQGADVLTTLGSYDFLDPVCVFSALFFFLTRVQRYTLMIFIKLYLIGLSFIAFCLTSEKKALPAVLSGALAYTFSGAVLYTAARHPNFINWAYYFPLLLTGIELFLRRKHRFPLIIIVFFNLITNYYTFYMNAVLAIVYILVCSICRLFFELPRSSLKAELGNAFQIAALFLAGILLSSFIFLPTVYAYLNNPRVMEETGYTASLWHYEPRYYIHLVKALFEPFYSPGYYTRIGFGVVIFVSLALLFTKKGHSRLKGLLLVSLVMLCVPAAGRFMNGMSYASNRWSYAFVFYGCYALVEYDEELRVLTKAEKYLLLLFSAVYILILLYPSKSGIPSKQILTAIMVGAATLFYLFSLSAMKSRFGIAMICLSLAGAFFQVYGTYSPHFGNYIGAFINHNELYSRYYSFSSAAAAGLEDSFYRIEEAEEQPNKNGLNSVYGTSIWWSMLPSNYLEFYNGLDLNTVQQNCYLTGLDGRTGLLELADVKYYTRPASRAALIPFGYTEIESSNDSFQIFKNQYALPIGYTYDRFITRSEYEALNGLEREQALLQAAVLEEVPSGFDQARIRTELIDLDWQITAEDHAELTKNQLLSTDHNAAISFSVDVPENCEIYLYIKGIRLLDGIDYAGITATRTAENYSVSKQAYILGQHYSWSFDRKALAYNLGYGHAGNNSISLTIDVPASFAIEDLQILAVPMSAYLEHAAARDESMMQNIVVGNDRVTGTISVPDKRILQFSIPYSIGWKAFIDGKETALMQSDVLYMAVSVDGGTHTVELRYSTPYLSVGCIFSGITLIFLCVTELLIRRRRILYNS